MLQVQVPTNVGGTDTLTIRSQSRDNNTLTHTQQLMVLIPIQKD